MKSRDEPLLAVHDLAFGFGERGLFEDVSFELRRGGFMSIVGPSGSGKSTLLNCVVGILRPARGTVRLEGTEVSGLPTSARAALRLAHIGMVFQFGELLPELPVAENVALPLVLAGTSRSEAHARATTVLDRMGLARSSTVMPATLSGGEMQRVAIARALVSRPALVVADEPTGMLDRATSTAVMAELVTTARESGAALLVVTHDQEVAAAADVTGRLQDGHLVVGDARPPGTAGSPRC